jgi:hypothetical protein
MDSHIKILSKELDKEIYLVCKNFFLNELKFMQHAEIAAALVKKMAYYCVLAGDDNGVEYYVDDASGEIKYIAPNNYHPTPIIIKNIVLKKCIVQMSVFIATNQDKNYKVEIKCLAFCVNHNEHTMSTKAKIKNQNQNEIFDVIDGEFDCEKIGMGDAKLKRYIVHFAQSNTNSDVMELKLNSTGVSSCQYCLSSNNGNSARYVFSTINKIMIEIKVFDLVDSVQVVQVRKFVV